MEGTAAVMMEVDAIADAYRFWESFNAVSQGQTPPQQPDNYKKADPAEKGSTLDAFWCAMARFDYNWQTGECKAPKNRTYFWHGR